MLCNFPSITCLLMLFWPIYPSTHFIAAPCQSQSTYSEGAWLTTVQTAATFEFVMWGEIKHQLGAWTEEGYDGRVGNAAYIAYIKFRTRPTRWDLSSASTVLSQQPQTNIWILNYDTLEPQHNAEVGHMAVCCRSRGTVLANAHCGPV